VDGIAAGSLTLGTLLGFAVGYTVAVARRAWFDYRDTRAKVPILRRAAWQYTGAATGRVVLVGVLVAAALWASVRG